MTNKEILQKALEKAKKNGFKLYALWVLCDNESWFDYKEKIIFSHEFAKAFWGEGKFVNWVEGYINEVVDALPEGVLEEGDFEFGESWNAYQPFWQFHLSKMVLEKEPLKYLEKFLKGEQLGK